MSAARRQRGLARQRDEGQRVLRPVEFEHGQLQEKPRSLAVAAIIEQCQNCLVQERRHPHHEFRVEAVGARLAFQPVELEIQRPHLDIGEHVDRMF
jgi:hypothetical protein